MNSVFSEQILGDKLSKLNNTQQCIETLSHWCIFHRKNAEQVVQTWEKQFHIAQKEQKTSFLYLANDILQNSKRNGNEFVGEFWKVLPKALKDVLDSGDEHGKNVVSRLVGIWEQRRVFGSRARGLNDLMLGNEPPPDLELNKKRSRSVRIVKRDTRSIKIKLSIGGTAEKIVSAFHTVLSEHPDEDLDLTRCKDAIRRVGKMEKDVDAACTRVGDPRRTALKEELQEKETEIKQCIEKLKLIESNREALVSQLKEALHEQESELENVRTQLQVAHAQVEQAANMRRRLNNEPTVPLTDPSISSEAVKLKSNGPSAETSKKTAAAIAAEVADRLAASTHSQQIMTSVLSTFAAEEAKNAARTPTVNPPSFSEPLRMQLENPMSMPMMVTSSHQPQTVLVQAQMQNQISTPQPQPQYNIYSTPTQQFLQQPSTGVMIGMPYTYTAVPPPPPPPPQLRPAPMIQQQQPMTLFQQPPPPMPPLPQFTLQQPAPPSYRPLQPPSMAFYHQQPQ